MFKENGINNDFVVCLLWYLMSEMNWFQYIFAPRHEFKRERVRSREYERGGTIEIELKRKADKNQRDLIIFN